MELVLSAEFKATCFTEEMSGYHISPHEGGEDLPSQFADLPRSARRLVSYAQYMKGESVWETLGSFEKRQLQQVMTLQPTVLSHLEIFRTYRGAVKGSLFHAINRTKTAAGARLLRSWLNFPLIETQEICRRQDEVQSWLSRPQELQRLRQVLGGMGDMERRLSQVDRPPHLLSLLRSLRAGLEVSVFCPEIEAPQLELLESLVRDIGERVSEEAPVALNKGGVICRGFDSELDELIKFDEEGQKLLLDMEAKERESTGIPSLKIRYNNVFGYYIEVTNTHKDRVPDRYRRKQTLAQAERYITEALQDLEAKILSAKAKRIEREQALFDETCKKVLDLTPDLLLLSRVWSRLDVLSGLAHLAQEHKYKRPQFSKNQSLELRASRHPVVEQELQAPFVPNNVVLGQGECLLLTGPNMAGKSTIMRQVAVISLMAQIGSFVPAEKAHLPIFHRLFTRIGASDSLAEGLSTFMVEMRETAEMLQQADGNSLVILDEVGRGTSTYDGMSLAQAILEFLVTGKGSMTFFATHYHELTSMSQRHPQVRNGHMSIREKNGEIYFLHLLVQGAANKSYGIQVAKLAGLPQGVTRRAATLLQRLEAEALSPQGHQGPQQTPDLRGQQLSLVPLGSSSPEGAASPPPAQEREKPHPLVEEIGALDIQSLTPLEALNRISQWQKNLRANEGPTPAE